MGSAPGGSFRSELHAGGGVKYLTERCRERIHEQVRRVDFVARHAAGGALTLLMTADTT